MTVSEAGLAVVAPRCTGSISGSSSACLALCSPRSGSSTCCGAGRGARILLLLLYAANLAFAWTYNVGDAYIFFLPSHYVVALCAGAGIAGHCRSRQRDCPIARSPQPRVALLLLYPVWRGYDTFPAAGSKLGHRAVRLLDEFAESIGDFPARPQDAVLGLDANWQVQNAVEYYMRERKPEFVWFVTEQLEWLEEGDRLRRFGRFVAANADIGRSMHRDRARPRRCVQHRRPRPRSDASESPTSRSSAKRIESVRPGTPYVLAVLRSDRGIHARHRWTRASMAMARARRDASPPCATTTRSWSAGSAKGPC